MLEISKFNKNIYETRKANFLGAIIGGAASLVGGALGKSAQDKATEAQQEAQGRAVRYIENIPEYQYITGSQPISYTMPEEYQYQTIEDSPEARAIQVENLQKLDQLAKEGYSPAMQKAFIDAQRLAGTEARGREGAIIESADRRGFGGSGAELALRQMASQAAADRISQAMADQAAKEAEAKQNAMAQAFSGAGQLRSADVNLSKSNTDIINAYNEANARRRQDAINANIALQNQYKQQELQEQRNVDNQNVNRAMDIAKAKASAAVGQGQTQATAANNQANYYKDVLGTLGRTAGGIYSELGSQPVTQVQQPTGSTPYPVLGDYTNFKSSLV